MSGGVFICYRREETAFAARAIHDRVVQRLERENVFLDLDNIDLGVDWFNVLTDRVGACDALVAVIGTNWVSSVDKDNRRRIDDPDDFVRIEIEAALKRDVRVIPVLVDGAAMPKASELPESLKGLARRQGTEVSPARFEADVEKLTIALGSILDERRRRDAAEAAPKVAETRRPVEAEAVRQPKENDGSGLLSGIRAIEPLSAPRSPPVRTYSPIIAATIAIGIAAALAILVATFGPPAWRFSAPADNKVAEQAAADKATADKAAADKTAADKTAADKAAAEQAAADKAAADKAAADKVAADKAAADKAAADKAAEQAAADKAAADKAAADKAAADKAAVTGGPLTAAQKRALKPGDSFKECNDCPEMIVVPAGRFTMGSREGQGHQNEWPAHDVTIVKPFAVAKFAVTFDEWDACAAQGDCDPHISDNGWGRGRRPAVNVSWDDAQTYLKWLSRITGRHYRLLSEAEYEYAERGGAQTAFPWGDDIKLNGRPMASCAICGGWDGSNSTAAVGSFPADQFGLYDMVGNIWEWVEDCWNDSYRGAPTGGLPWTTGDCAAHVIRGGIWWGTAAFGPRSANRSKGTAFGLRFAYLGFRVARTLVP
jgi:formylglycine-generating enzyme required for sulfatase activity